MDTDACTAYSPPPVAPAVLPTVALPASYRICVRGRLDRAWGERLGGMVLTGSTAGGETVTCLEGELSDQSALVGVINSLHDLRLPVLSVLCLAADPG